ncbi:MAG: FAD:protein FMN transferase [Firmicutes bacterium]|nr:FAD:protein FMN transferase [Bacillota bacterium]
METLTRRFSAMGTEVALYVRPEFGRVGEAEAALSRWEEWFRHVHRVLNRFDPESELSRLNRAPGRYHVVSPLLGEVLAAALVAARRTGGLFDPTLLPELVAAGYDRPLADLFQGARPAPAGSPGLSASSPGPSASSPGLSAASPGPSAGSPGPSPAPGGRWQQVQVLRLPDGGYLVERPEGVQLDLGGLAKGWAADRAARALSRFGPAAADVGGDLRVAIPRAERERDPDLAWPVAVADPFRPDCTLLALSLTGGAVCTSDTLGRRWRRGDAWCHHILDPRTGRPAAAGAVAATVIAPRATLAEALTKGCLVLGPEAAIPWAEAHGALALVVAEDGTVRMSKELERIADAAVD